VGGLVIDTSVDEVGAVVGSLLGLTILPASDPLVASYGLVAIGVGTCPLSASVRTRATRPAISGSFSVASGLTEPPSLQLAPAFQAGGDLGGGGVVGVLCRTGMQLVREVSLGSRWCWWSSQWTCVLE
jgi:hypothetical protein